MTIGELIVYNSTILSGAGTVLEHLLNIVVDREVFYGVGVNVEDIIDLDVSSGIIAVNIVEETLSINITDGMSVETQDSEIGVNI